MSALLHLDALPRNTTKGTLVRLLVQVGELDKNRIGAIQITGRKATVEVPSAWLPRLVRVLDNTPLGHQHIRAWSAADKSQQSATANEHFARLLRWIDLEAAAEAEAAKLRMRRLSASEAERSGQSLVQLVIRDETTGLGARVLVTLAKRDAAQGLPWTRLGVGSPVLLSEEGLKDPDPLRGIVSRRDSQTIEVALARWPEPEADRPTFRIDLSSDEIARDRQRYALQRAQNANHERLEELRQVLLGEREPKFAPSELAPAAAAQLNASQRDAIAFALSARDVAIIHGPPGTGKTTTVVELIRLAVAQGEKVLACAPSNLAVDNMLERLIALGVGAVRLGHPARVSPELRAHTLDLMVENHADLKVARKLIRDANQLQHKAARYTRAKPQPGARQQLRAEARQLLADAERIERQAVAQILDHAEVLCVTLTGLDSDILGGRQFDLAVIDEACQSTEPACWIPLLRAGRVILAGDHFQLPPTVVHREAGREGFSVSLLERLIELYGATRLARRLEVQYRMHQAIMAFSSAEFYDDVLVADPSVAAHVLADLPDVVRSPLTETPLEFIDTAGASYDEQPEPDGESRLNPQEAEVVERKVTALLEAGVSARDIAVISPYAAQVRSLRQRLAALEVEVDTVDGFQGREKEAVIISLVRSNPSGEIGFLADVRRMNVALTRARRKLIVIGDSATIAGHEFYQRLLEYFELLGGYKTVWEEMY
jgi:superfamily I DNA and/or RNA helicase